MTNQRQTPGVSFSEMLRVFPLQELLYHMTDLLSSFDVRIVPGPLNDFYPGVSDPLSQ